MSPQLALVMTQFSLIKQPPQKWYPTFSEAICGELCLECKQFKGESRTSDGSTPIPKWFIFIAADDSVYFMEVTEKN